MGRKKTAKVKRGDQDEVNWQIVTRMTKDMKLKDLQRACIARGMDFEQMASSSVLGLHSWFGKNYDNGQDINRLNEYDAWVESELLKINPEYDRNHPLNHPALRLGYFGEVMDSGEVKKKKVRLKGVDKPKKKKKERIEGTKVIKGTKKGMTYELTKKGLELDDILEKVEEAFDDVNPNSVKIWYNRALKELKNAKG